jgi:hypothetical protein
LNELESSLTDELMQRWETPSGDPLSRLERLFIPNGKSVAGVDAVTIAEGDVLDEPFDVAAGDCTAAIAVSEQGVDIDLFLFTPDGQIVKRDEGTDSFPVIDRYCPQQTGTFTYRIRSPKETVVKWRRYAFESTAGDQMIESIRQEYAANTRSATPVQTNALREGQRFQTPFVAEAATCYQIIGAGLDGIGDLDVYVRNEDGDIDVQELAVGPSLVTKKICVETTQRLNVEFRSHRGDGRFRWQIVQSTAQDSGRGPGQPSSADTPAERSGD